MNLFLQTDTAYKVLFYFTRVKYFRSCRPSSGPFYKIFELCQNRNAKMLQLKIFIKRLDSISWDPTLYSIKYRQHPNCIVYSYNTMSS